MYKISMIIPVYNAEKYLKRTINSIINQSIGFENIELILVDDNSQDNSKSIIEEYVAKYDNVIGIYSNENHGFPGFGRNNGIEIASGQYIMFSDNDDEHDKDLCLKLYEAIVSEDADIASCDKVKRDNIKDIPVSEKYVGGKLSSNGNIIVSNDDLAYFEDITIWNKIFKKEIIADNNIRFVENMLAEDLLFCLEVFFNSSKLVYLEKYYGYFWDMHEESLSHECSPKHVENLLNSIPEMFKILDKYNKKDLDSFYFKFYLRNLLRFFIDVNTTGSNLKSMIKKLYNYEKEAGFGCKANEGWANIINFFIVHRFFNLAILIITIMKASKESAFLRKIFRSV